MTESFFHEQPDTKPDSSISPLDDSDDSGGEDSAEEPQSGDRFKTEEGRMAAIMSYIPFLCFLPLLNMKENKEAQFHARQGVMLFLIELLAVLFLIDGISKFVFQAILIVAAALSVAGVYFALQGKNYKLPVISDLVEKSKL